MKNIPLIIICIISISMVTFYKWASSSTNDVNAESRILKISNHILSSSLPMDSTLTIMTYNMGYLSGMTNNQSVKVSREFHENNLSIFKDYLNNSQPDIIAFQEIDYSSNRSYDIDQEREIGKLFYPYAAKAVNWDKSYLPFPHWPISVHFRKVVSGQSVLSNYAIDEQRIDTLVRVQDEPFYYKDFYLNRLAQICTLKVNNNPVVVINVHLEAFDADTRQLHTEAVLELFEQYSKKYPTIIAGDFNSDPRDEKPTINTFLKKGVKSAIAEGDNNSFTYPSDNPDVMIDYIFYSDHFELVQVKVVKELGAISDHLPVYAKLKLKKF